MATVIADIMNGSREPSLSTLIARRGIQPTIDVFLPMNATVIKAVDITVSVVNLSFYFR